LLFLVPFLVLAKGNGVGRKSGVIKQPNNKEDAYEKERIYRM